jgi:molybdopterin-guanine dinucleotide biosynthesis protein A
MSAARRTEKKARLVTFILLAGGPSRRMKKDKAVLPAPVEPLIQKILGQVEGVFDEIVVSVAKGRRYDFLPYRQVEDTVEGQGPLAGILAGLRAARYETALVAACDIPVLKIDVLKKLIEMSDGCDIVVPRTPKGLEPLLAVYKRSVLPRLEKLLASGERQVLALFDLCRTEYINLADAAWLENLNTPEDYDAYLNSLDER